MLDRATSQWLTPATFRPRAEASSIPYAPRFATAHAADMAAMQPPTIIEGETLIRVVDNTRGWLELKRFRCGYANKNAEAEIRATTERLTNGVMVDRGNGVTGPNYQRVVSLERPDGEVISWCGLTRRHLCEIEAPIPPGGYIFAIATSAAYRGQRLDVGGTRPADAVMLRSLEVLREDLGDGTTPYVWARVLPGNLPSNRLFHDHVFDLYALPAFEQAIRARPAGLDPAQCRSAKEHPLAA